MQGENPQVKRKQRKRREKAFLLLKVKEEQKKIHG